MRVLHLIKTGEGATWACRQMKVLVAQGVHVAVCVPKGKMTEQYKAAGVQVYEFNFTLAPHKLLSSFAAFRKVIKDFQPDMIHSHFLLTTLYARVYRMFNKLDMPLMFQVPGPLHLEHALFRQADLRTSNKNDIFIGSCKWTSDKYISSGIPKDKVFMSYYGTDLSFIQKQPAGKLRAELNLQEDDFIVAMVAYMYKPKKYIGQKKGIKGHEDFFSAVAKCVQQQPKIKAVVIGGAWDGATEYERSLITMGKAACGNNIYFLGNRNDVPALYADINISVHPSYSENLGGAAESLLLEVPTIATNIGGFPDIVIAGETGYSVHVNAPDEIAACIMDAYNNYEKAKSMAIEGKKRLKQMLDVNNTGKEIYRIYNQILNDRAKYVPVYQKAV